MNSTPVFRLHALFSALSPVDGGLCVTCPGDGSLLARLGQDDKDSIYAKIRAAQAAQMRVSALPRAQREALVIRLSEAVRAARLALGEIITLEGGKSEAEGQGEADGAADILAKTVKDAALPELGGMLRVKERPPVGLVGLITSFNFPLAVANWTIAPALLAGNAVLWKPSEKTPLTALYYKQVFDAAMGEFADLLQVVIGGRDVGEALVAAEEVSLISATGSVAMGRGIKATLVQKADVGVPPILELGGNNGVILTHKMNDLHREWSVLSLLNSFFGSAGQRCTNTRRLIVHRAEMDAVVGLFQKHIGEFIRSGAVKNPLAGPSNVYGYGPLIDADAFARFEAAKAAVSAQGGQVWGGARLHASEWPDAYYVEPALA
ncbi:MAG: aldehyde dehydrogenase family protein, partial [Rickettsiales bacterium]|nr:aldehyde dehydrogenase family protein [Rickettsiales bacterium]